MGLSDFFMSVINVLREWRECVLDSDDKVYILD